MNAPINPISRIDPPFQALVAAAATGPGADFLFSQPCRIISMQVVFTGGSPTVKVNLEGTIDGVDWFVLGAFDTTAQGVSGGIISVNTAVVLGVRANLATLSGGSAPTVSAQIQGSPYA